MVAYLVIWQWRFLINMAVDIHWNMLVICRMYNYVWTTVHTIVLMFLCCFSFCIIFKAYMCQLDLTFFSTSYSKLQCDMCGTLWYSWDLYIDIKAKLFFFFSCAKFWKHQTKLTCLDPSYHKWNTLSLHNIHGVSIYSTVNNITH